MGVFHSSAITLLKHRNAEREGELPPLQPGQFPVGGGLILEDWVRAVVKGADERSARWKHLVILGGLRLGLEGHDEPKAPRSLRHMLDGALVKAVDLAVLDSREGEELGAHCIALVLNHTFPLISDFERTQLDYDHLLPVLVGSLFFSREGLQSAYFLGPVDRDVNEVPGKKFNWPATSSSFQQIQSQAARPLMIAMGPLSRLIAHAVENIRDPWIVQTMMEDILSFSATLHRQWRVNKLSKIDFSEEAFFLVDEAMTVTLPLLWKLLKNTMFATTIVLRGVLGRVLGDSVLAADAAVPLLVTQTLHILRNFYFISTRSGADAFSQYTFVYLTAIDILAQYPIQADRFLKEIKPTELGQIPNAPLDRCLDLFFLNTAEHFTLILSPQSNEELLVAAALPYLTVGGHHNLLNIFEAAHSVMLAVLSATQSAGIAAKHLPFYVDALFGVFPENLSARQFRLAFKTLMKVIAPPSPLSATHQDLPGTLLELVHYRALNAPTTPLPSDIVSPHPNSNDTVPPLSEQSVLILTLLDALPFLPVSLLEEWLPICASLVNVVADLQVRDICRKRFWELIVSGEMDPERSQACVAWWATRGGREHVLFGDDERGHDGPYMSGALAVEPRESKL